MSHTEMKFKRPKKRAILRKIIKMRKLYEGVSLSSDKDGMPPSNPKK